MWIRVGAFRVKPDKVETLSKTYNEEAVPKVRAVAGNCGCILLEPTANGDEHVVITLWKDKAAADAYEASGAAAEVVGLVRDCFAGPPTLRSYESKSGALL